MQVFRVSEEPPDSRSGIENFLIGGKRPVVVNPRDFLAEITRRDGPPTGAFIRPPWIDTGGDRTNRGTQLRDGLGIFDRQRLARAFIGRESASMDAGIEAEDEK